MSPIGLAIAGPVADVLGVQSWFLIAGVFSIGIGVGAFFIPALMHIEERPAENVANSNSLDVFQAVGFPYQFHINPGIGHVFPRDFGEKLGQAIAFVMS